MIPYIEFTQFSLGPLTIHVWGIFVALGFLLGTWACARFAKEQGLQAKIFWDALAWIIIGSLLVGRIFHVFFYEPEFYLAHPGSIFAIWEGGMSIMGGFVGALFFGVWYLYARKVDIWKYVAVGIFGLPLGLFVGRIGCFLIHDHPGTPTHFFLGVLYPDGVVRHDHGLYLSLNGLVLFLFFLWMRKQKINPEAYPIVFLLWYGTVRFFLDFFRATEGAIVDERYLSLTPAQYASIGMVLLGLFLTRKFWKKV